jgi:hypothetical protein
MTQKMTELSWAAPDLNREFPAATNLGELIEVSSKAAREKGQFVCAVNVNGVDLNEEQESQFDKIPMGEIQRFSIKTQSLAILLDESIGQCRVFLGQLMSSLETAAHMFRAEDLNAAHRFYSTCIDGTQLFIEMVTHYKVACQNSPEGTYPPLWSQLEQTLEKSLLQILEAYRQKNYILVADLLEYELSPILGQWQTGFANGNGVSSA